MKVLKIINSKAFFVDPSGNDQSISDIGADDLLHIFNLILTEDNIDMDDFRSLQINQPAEKIVYEKIYEKIENTLAAKSDIISSINSEYQSAIDKYIKP
jgi:hypothetical protein